MDKPTQSDPKYWPSPWREIGILPEASLRGIFPDRQAVDDRLREISEKSKGLAAQYEGRLDQLPARGYAQFLSQREAIEALSHSISQFTYFLRVRDANAAKICNELSASLKDARIPLQKIIDEDNKLSTAKLQTLADDPDIGVYRINVLKAVEHSKLTPQTHDVPIWELDDAYRGGGALFQQLHARVNAKVIKASQDEFSTVKEAALREHIETFTYLLASSHRSLDVIRQWTGFKSPVEFSCKGSQVTINEIDALRDAVHEAVPSTTRSYWSWRARKSETGDVKYSDSTLSDQDKRIYSWKFSEALVCDAYNHFSPELGAIARSFVDELRIDALPGPGRHDSNRAFPGDPYFKSIIFLNYRGTQSDVYLFGHEMGHGIHSSLSLTQNFYSTQANTLIAETVALFGERLIYEEMQNKLENDDDKKILKAQWTDRRMGSVFDSMRKHDFEKEIYDLSVKGLASAEMFSQTWKEGIERYTSDKVVLSELTKLGWVHEHHLFDSKFYNYSYTFAALVAEYLWCDYQKRGPAFVSDYMDLMRAGGSKTTHELLAPFGINEMNLDFWRRCLEPLKADVARLQNEEDTPVHPNERRKVIEKLAATTDSSLTPTSFPSP